MAANPQLNMVALAHRIQPQPSELGAAKLHRGVVRTRLDKSFDVSRLVPIGSHARGTAIRTFSDLDVMVVLRRNEAKWGGSIVQSTTLVNRVREDLALRFPLTDVRADAQAVVIRFAQGQQSLDVVPALFQRFDRQRPVVAIPNGDAGWMETSPEAHNKLFAEADERTGSKLRKVVQLLRWWKYSRANPIPLASFYLDMVMAASGLFIGVKPYTHCLYEAFKHLSDRECRGWRDPLGISGVVFAANTEVKAAAAVNAVEYAFDHAKAALAAEVVKDFEEANRQWSIVFNDGY